MSYEHYSEAATESTKAVTPDNNLSEHDCEIPTASNEAVSSINMEEKANDTAVLQPPVSEDAEQQIQQELLEDEAAKEEDADEHDQEEEEEEKEKEEEEEEEEEFDYYAVLQEDEEERDYMPDHIEQFLNNPPPRLGVNSSTFRRMFDDICNCMPPHRPKSDAEFEAALNATVAYFRAAWLDRQMANLVKLHERPAAEALHLSLQAVVPPTKKYKEDLERHAKEGAMDYFADPAYRTKFIESLERGGLGAEAVEAEAFRRAIPSLAVTERMRKSAIKEYEQALKVLKEAYALRDPEERMPLSASAERRFWKEVAEDRKLVREERLLKESQKAAENGEP
ncbi:hypothetical protein QRQ56_25245 [Bradyrhizobium sp. U531]|uniref:hypothetical protein n=1 Tax=Bradyrhizobium sp. U531 TaxID=3053458 RepID=UPI003F422090